MTPSLLQWAVIAGIIVVAAILVRFPRALFTEAAGYPPSVRVQVALTVVVSLVGIATFLTGLGRSPEGRFALAVAMMTCACVVYSDFSFLVIPDLYSLVLLALAFLAPWKFAPQEALVGLFFCGGLLAILAFLWHRLTLVEGLGFGDVKLAGAVGALLSAQPGLFAIAASAFGALILALAVRALQRNRRVRDNEEEEPPLVPYGAALALASAAFLAKGMV